MTRSRWLFGCAVFLGAFLLFLVEPIAAKQLLPVLGGSAAVWITCLVFFQTALLCAYLYAHWMSNRPRWFVYFVLLLVGLLRQLDGACAGVDGSALRIRSSRSLLCWPAASDCHSWCWARRVR